MRLDDFVRQTLIDITNGVTEAQKKSKLYIAPGYIEGMKLTSPQMVDFEIAVTVNKEAGGGIQIWSLGDVKASGHSINVNKISFSVPVYFQSPTELNENNYKHRDKQEQGK